MRSRYTPGNPVAESKAGVRTTPAAAIFVAVFFFAIAILLFSVAMRGIDHDEDHYMLGARFFADHVIYRDYLYQQPPFHPALLGSVYELFAERGLCKNPCYAFLARLLNWFFAVGVIAIFYLTLRTMFEQRLAIVGCTLLTFTSSFYHGASVVRNDLMPLLLSLLAVYVLMRPLEAKASRRRRALVAGICALGAVGTKLNYIHVPPALFLFLALWPPDMKWGERLREQVIPFSIGALIGLASIALFAAPDPALFYFGVFQSHSNPPPQWLAARLPGNYPHQMLADTLMRTPTSVLIVLSTFLILLIGLDRPPGRPLAYFYGNGQWLFFLILVAGIAVCLLPAPSYKWYFIPIAPFLILCFASLWSYPTRNGLVHSAVLAIAVLACIPNFIDIASKHLTRTFNPPKWRPVKVHAASVRLDEILDAMDVRGKIATLSPSRIIDTKRDFYPELASAWAFFPRAAFMPDADVRRLHGASPATLASILEADMPAAIFGGYEKNDGDDALFAFAEAHGYRRVEDEALGRGILFVRQPQASTDP